MCSGGAGQGCRQFARGKTVGWECFRRCVMPLASGHEKNRRSPAGLHIAHAEAQGLEEAALLPPAAFFWACRSLPWAWRMSPLERWRSQPGRCAQSGQRPSLLRPGQVRWLSWPARWFLHHPCRPRQQLPGHQLPQGRQRYRALHPRKPQPPVLLLPRPFPQQSAPWCDADDGQAFSGFSGFSAFSDVSTTGGGGHGGFRHVASLCGSYRIAGRRVVRRGLKGAATHAGIAVSRRIRCSAILFAVAASATLAATAALATALLTHCHHRRMKAEVSPVGGGIVVAIISICIGSRCRRKRTDRSLPVSPSDLRSATTAAPAALLALAVLAFGTIPAGSIAVGLGDLFGLRALVHRPPR